MGFRTLSSEKGAVKLAAIAVGRKPGRKFMNLKKISLMEYFEENFWIVFKKSGSSWLLTDTVKCWVIVLIK